VLHYSIRLPFRNISEEAGLSVQHVKKILKEQTGKILENKLHQIFKNKFNNN
jgi:hypothetical protein